MRVYALLEKGGHLIERGIHRFSMGLAAVGLGILTALGSRGKRLPKEAGREITNS